MQIYSIAVIDFKRKKKLIFIYFLP